jgi:putative membrane protein
MQEFLLNNYLWLKAFHLISVISWMAAMLYLPRLFVYHAEANQKNKEPIATLKVMERRLLKFIMNPAMGATWLFGGLMIFANPALFEGGWLHVKLTAVILLSGMHGMMSKWQRQFANDQNTKSAKFYRIMNEVPTAFMILIVIMAVVKPF